MVPVGTARPAAAQERRSTSGSDIDPAAGRMARNAPNVQCLVQNPAGESAVTERTSFSRLNSRAGGPPSGCPPHGGGPRPGLAEGPEGSGVTVAGSYGTPSGSAGEAVAGQVDGDDIPFHDEDGDHRVPALAVVADAVERQRIPGTRPLVRDGRGPRSASAVHGVTRR